MGDTMGRLPSETENLLRKKEQEEVLMLRDIG